MLKLVNEIDIAGMTKAWIMPLKTESMRHMSERVSTILERNEPKGYEALIDNPIIPYKVVSRRPGQIPEHNNKIVEDADHGSIYITNSDKGGS